MLEDPNQGPILHRGSISFHLSHQPPLKVMCHFLYSKSDIYYDPDLGPLTPYQKSFEKVNVGGSAQSVHIEVKFVITVMS